METPIIDPSTLTEEQRKKIRAAYSGKTNHAMYFDRDWANGARFMLVKVFGKSIFEKGENNELD